MDGAAEKSNAKVFGVFSAGNDATARRIAASLRNAGARSVLFEFDPQLDHRPVVEFAQRTITGGVDLVIFQTAATFRKTLEIAEVAGYGERLIDALSDIEVVTTCREVARTSGSLGVNARLLDIGSGNEEAWRLLLKALDGQTQLLNRTVAIETCDDVHSLAAGLAARGADVVKLDPFAATIAANDDAGLIERLVHGRLDGVAFASAAGVGQFVALACRFFEPRNGDQQGSTMPARIRTRVQHMLEEVSVIAGDEDTARFASGRLGVSVATVASKQTTGVQVKHTTARSNADKSAAWLNGPFMKACRGEPTEVTPIWMMRQAGRYMQEYREVRARVSFLELCANPQLCSEVMCTAVERLGVDAAIIFSDLLPILVPMGLNLEFVKGDGPKIHNPVRTARDIDRIVPLSNNDELMFVMETVTQTRKDLPEHIPLIGFAGAPFTLASYLIEGGASRNYAHTKKLMFSDSSAWHELMTRLTSSISIYLNGQVGAGAQCLQLFDSWAGCLSEPDYRRFVFPFVKQIISSVPDEVPVINFATGNPALLPLLSEAGARVVGVDWRVRLDEAWKTVGHGKSVQGNLDPTVLLTNHDEIRRQAKSILDQAEGRPGHIFNLGHGILPETPVENAIALVESVHELSAK